MNITLAQLVADFAALGLALESTSESQRTISGIAPVEASGPGDLVFMDKRDYLPAIEQRRPAAVICPPRLKGLLAGLTENAVLTVPTVVAFLIMRGEVSRWVVFGYLGALVVGLAAIQFAL